MPSVWTVNVVAGVPIDSVEVAWPVTLPPLGETKVIVHWPCAFVLAPAWVQVPVAGFGSVAPFDGVSVDGDVLTAGRDEGARPQCPSAA